MGYMGSEEFIRLQFEEYLLSMISSTKYHLHLERYRHEPKYLLPDVEGDPSHDFSLEWIDAWMNTDNFRIFQKHTGRSMVRAVELLKLILLDSHLFDVVEPKHPCAGGLTIDDIQRRLAQQVSELHLDERFNVGKEVLGKHLASGQKKVSSAFNNVWADIEVMREAQRKRHEEQRAAGDNGTAAGGASGQF